MPKHEVDYYPEIVRYLSAQVESELRKSDELNLHAYWGIGELSAGLRRIIKEHPEECACIEDFALSLPPLDLDIFSIITNGRFYELLIIEVKLLSSAGLKELSQLIGYCVVSGAKQGLLVNVDGGASLRLDNLLKNEHQLSNIVRKVDNEYIDHKLGFMIWDSATQNLRYTNLGAVTSVTELCSLIISRFEKKSYHFQINDESKAAEKVNI